MKLSLLPKVIADALPDITPDFLHSRGLAFLMLDFDNTIIPYTTNEPTPRIRQWLNDMKAAGISLCVVSNSRKERVRNFCKKHDLACITHSGKPFGSGISKALKRFRAKPEQAALVGDQIFTDVLGANLNGVTSILVKAIDNHHILLKARHTLEKPFIYLARKRRISYEEHG